MRGDLDPDDTLCVVSKRRGSLQAREEHTHAEDKKTTTLFPQL
jgi:hypothetical protein